jgi:alanyl-tRNA synthetase
MITSQELRAKYLQFMESKGHVIIPSSSLVPKEDPTVLFTTAGMQPIIPYLTGTPHPAGRKITNSQKCLRTLDIEEVGDNRHLTFFEMLGNWGMGSYFKEEIIMWTFEFLTSSDYLGLDPKRLFVTVYKGSDLVSADEEAIAVWEKLFASVGVEPTVGDEFDFSQVSKSELPKESKNFLYRITKRSGKDNWWGLPYKGPCGPCSEVYYLLNNNDVDTDHFKDKNYGDIEDFVENQIVEIWNNVFMMYEGEKNELSEPKYIEPLKHNNIDTGAGFERLLTVINGYETPYETDVLKPLVDVVNKYATTK